MDPAGLRYAARMRAYALSALLVVAVGCSHATRARPTPLGAYEVEAAVGGPLVDVGPVIPAPMSSVGVRRGIHERGDVAAHLHLTHAVFGITGGDLDTTWRIWSEQGALPQLSLNSRFYAFNKEGEVSNYLEFTPSLSWLLGERYLTYLSASGLVQFAGGPMLFSFAAGEEIRFGRFSLLAELRWYDPGLVTAPVAVKWQPLFGRGGWGIVLGGSVRFGGGR